MKEVIHMDNIRKREFIFEYIDDHGNYVKCKGIETERMGFYLRFIHEHFIPCKQCQKKLLNMINNAKTMTLGNKDYDPLIELWKKFDEIDDKQWQQLEKRKATKEEISEFEEGETTYL